MLYVKQNIDSEVVTNVHELAEDNIYTLYLRHEQYDNEELTISVTSETQNNRYTSFILNLGLRLGDYRYVFTDSVGNELEVGLLKIIE